MILSSVGNVGTLWFAIFLQLFLILGVLYTLASDSIAMHRFQISVFGAIAIVFSVNGVQAGIFANRGSLIAMGVGWLLLSMVNIVWVIYFTSEEDSLVFYILNSMGNGGLTPPSRRRRRTQSSVHNMSTGNGYAGNYASGGISSHDVTYDAKLGGGSIGPVSANGPAGGVRSQTSFVTPTTLEAGNRSIGPAGSIARSNSGGPGSAGGTDNGPNSPLMAGVGGAASTVGSEPAPEVPETFVYKAKAMFACVFLSMVPRRG